jgi:parallel beta-helix repeat protein
MVSCFKETSKIKSTLLLTLVSIILLYSNFGPNTTKNFSSENTKLNIPNYPASAVNHNRILINGNDELATFIENEYLGGDGNYTSPYIIKDFTIDASWGHGIEISNTDAYLIIKDCKVKGRLHSTYYGIFLNNCKKVNVTNNELTINTHGITLIYSMNNSISRNTAYNNEIAIYLRDSRENILSENNVYENFLGYNLVNSSKNSILKNKVNKNVYGIYLSSKSNENSIFNNDFSENQPFQSFEEFYCFNNRWDNGTAGNYWGNDYILKYPNSMNDGIVWNTPYEIDGVSLGIDNFPLVNFIYPNFEPPTLANNLQYIRINEGYSGLNTTWIATDLHPATYIIKLDGIEVVSATEWNNGIEILYIIPNGLLNGDYNITIFISDENGNIAQGSVIILVISSSDFDQDGMNDSWEELYNLNPLDANDAEYDPDGDGLTNLEEYLLDLNPQSKDTDNDGVPDNVDMFPNTFFVPTGIFITIFGSVGIFYTILKIIKKEKKKLQNLKID